MNSLFDILEYKQILTRGTMQRPVVESLSAQEIFDLAEAIVTLTTQSEPCVNKTVFAHSAALSLSGSREDCARLCCRESRISELARFALLYSDQVYVNNWFYGYSHIRSQFDDPREEKDENKLREFFFEDLCLLEKLRPLLENGFVALFTPNTHTCPSCLAKSAFGPSAGERLKQEQKRLAEEYLLNTSISFEKNEMFGLRCSGPETYFEHGGIIRTSNEAPKLLASMPRVMRKVLNGESVPLSAAVKKNLKIHEELAERVVRNISFDLATAEVLGTSFLTNKSLHISFLQSLSNNQDIERRNSIACRYLSSMVPFVEDVAITDLIKLRKREEDAFIRYRHALNQAIDEFREGNAFTERDAKTLYSDVIAPRLSSLEQGIKDAKRDLVRKPLTSVGALVGVISFGMYTGFLPSEVIAMAKALGLSKFAYDVLEKALSLKDTEKNIRSEDLYFLWKVRRTAQK
jgi:hypothetical protein